MSGSGRETVEERTRKRRWLSLAELVGVGGLLIAGAGLYLSWSDRQEKVAVEAQGSRFDIRGEAASGGNAIMLVRDEKHEIEEATVTFPAGLGVAPKAALANEIERGWIEKPLLKATDGGPDDQTGTLPVLLRVRYSDAGATHMTSSIYDIVWRTEGRTFPRGRRLTLVGLKLRERGGSAHRLDQLWATASAHKPDR